MLDRYPYSVVDQVEPDPRRKSDQLESEPTSNATIKSRWQGWRMTVAVGTLVTAIVLLLNIALLIWAKHRDQLTPPLIGRGARYEGAGPTYSLYEPEVCNDVKKVSVYGHLAINVVSTLLLAASASAIQCLSAPTREDVDAAHSVGRWLHIGVLGFRNWRNISGSRKLLWLLLALTSLPLHLVYNSVIFTEQVTNDYDAIYVAKNFVDGASWNFTATPYMQGRDQRLKIDEVMNGPSILESNTTRQKHTDHINMLQNNNDQLIRLDGQHCIDTYNHAVMSDYRSVIIVLDTVDDSNSLLGIVVLNGYYRYHIQEWVCIALPPGYPGDCKGNVSSVSTDWIVSLPRLPIPLPQPVPVMYCLAQKVSSRCRLSFSVPLMVVVIVCNSIKLICLVLICFKTHFEPLVTCGDGIASFLRTPDPITEKWGPISYQGVKKLNACARVAGPISEERMPKRRHWFLAAGVGRWCWTIFLCFATWLIAFCLVVATPSDASSTTIAERFRKYWAAGLTAPLPTRSELIQITRNAGIIPSSLFANLPQLIISLLYVCYNGLFTSMLTSSECMSYLKKRKPLRVSQPQGQQRSTYWLQLPYRYSLPLLTTMAALHWAVSQSLFMIRLKQLDINGELSYKLTAGTTWSGMPAIISLIIGAVMIFGLLANGFRKYHGRMPVMSTCSLSLSSACHRDSEDQDMVLKPLQYGVIQTRADGTHKFGFSAQPVVPIDDLEHSATIGTDTSQSQSPHTEVATVVQLRSKEGHRSVESTTIL